MSNINLTAAEHDESAFDLHILASIRHQNAFLCTQRAGCCSWENDWPAERGQV
jgi:hypothetical protein